ncbi:BTB domain-containing protein [Mycena venus]|uniref:BTB domain-containing protein n=1 Tax=Mycena venus TaxID=2733690 RepID=A0A8H7CZX0_9AGAR|nr:BTB domain-containing protein [Mycena venus]
MQGLPQPPDQPNVDGCPMVELSDDPVDVEYLLKALYIPTFHCQNKLPLAVVAAFIRLGRKYDFKDLFNSAVARLTSDCPATLEEYDVVQTEFKTIEEHSDIMLDLITLASQNNIMSILPCAYYYALQDYSLAELFDGVQKSDGTVASLSPADLRRCVIAKEKLLAKQLQPGYTLGWARKWEFDDCTSHPRCRVLREAILIRQSDDAAIHALTPLSWFRRLSFCATCALHVADSVKAGRKKMWDELPGFFDLPPGAS